MFKSVGENSEDGYEATSFGSDDDVSADGYSVHFQPPEDIHDPSESRASSPPVRKMFWHPSRIDKVQDLVPEEIRWFYKEDPKAKWVAFIGYDSLRIECRFRALEHARKTSNTSDEDDIDTHIHVRGGLYEVDINNSKVNPIYWKGQSLPILRGTWFVDGTGQPLEHNYSLQLEQDHLAKFKGQPIPDPHTNEKKPSRSEALHTVKFREFHVDWYDVNEVYMYSEAASSRMFRYVTNKFSIRKPGTGTRLYRGYYEEAKMDDKPPDVTQLVFVVHGIGQKYNQNRIISCCNDLRNGTHKLIPKYFPDLTSSRQRIEFLPVEWRTDLQLDGDLVESITPEKLRNLRVILNSTAMDILYYTSPLYRGEIINGLTSELNRLYNIFVERNPYFEANNGQVSVCAHSLGSVILYDILTGWDPIELYDQYVSNVLKTQSTTEQKSQLQLETMTSSDRSKKLHDFYINSIVQKESSPLVFKVENLFSLGSPLGVFLTLRGIRPKPNGLMDHLLPKSLCKRFYNVYHASDPVAYRIEPLVLKHYSTIAPLKIHKLHEANKVPYSEMKAKAYAAFEKAAKPVRKRRKSDESDTSTGGTPIKSDSKPDDAKQSHLATGADLTDGAGATGGDHSGLKGALKGLFSKLGGRGSMKAEEKLAAELNAYQNVCSEDETDDARTEEVDLIEHTDLEFRLDYVLPSSGGMMTNSYVSAIFSHTSYWSTPEIALFLLTNIFPDFHPIK